MADLTLFRVLVVAEAHALAWHVRDKCLSKANAGLCVDFLILLVRRIGRVNDVSILGRDNFLDENSHINLVNLDTEFLGGKESSFIELTCPHPLDGFPCLIKLACLDAKFDQLFLEEEVMAVIWVELKTHDQIFALVEHFVHFLHAFDR